MLLPPIFQFSSYYLHYLPLFPQISSTHIKKVQPTRDFSSSFSLLQITNPWPPPCFFLFYFLLANYPMTTGFIQPRSMDIFFFFSSGPNKRIRGLCGPPACRMMRVGGVSNPPPPKTPPKEHQSQHCCGTVGSFELSGKRRGHRDEWHTGWSHHLANHVGTLYQDSIITLGLLNLDKTYRLSTRGKARVEEEEVENNPWSAREVKIFGFKAVSKNKSCHRPN